MFVAAKGRDTFTPNIFSTHENAKRANHPSWVTCTARHFDARDLIAGHLGARCRSVPISQ
jgi:hypothetical protein